MANDSAIDAPLRWKYVDDLTLGETVCKDSTNKSQLHVDLDKLDSWCNDNDMLPKCHVMHISFLKNQPEFPKFTLNSEEITTADNMKLLGVTMQTICPGIFKPTT